MSDDVTAKPELVSGGEELGSGRGDVYIRPAEVFDWVGIDKCNRAVLLENYKESTYKDILNSQYTSNFVLIDDDLIVGYIIAILQGDNVMYGHVISLGILEKYQKQGFGKILMELVELDMIKFKIKYMELQVRKSNIPAIKLYTCLGYQCVKKIKYQSDDGYILRKTK